MSNPVSSVEFWRIGRLLKPWGKNGEWLAASENGDPRRFQGLARLYIRLVPGGVCQPATLESATMRGGRVMLKFSADASCGPQAELLLPENEINQAAQDDLPYEHELIGATLADPAGRLQRIIRSLHPWPQGATLLVECSGQ